MEASKVDEVKDVGAELDISGKMNQIMEEKMANFSISRVERTEEEVRIKEAILAGFSEVADGETDDSDEEGGDGNLALGGSSQEGGGEDSFTVKEGEGQAG